MTQHQQQKLLQQANRLPLQCWSTAGPPCENQCRLLKSRLLLLLGQLLLGSARQRLAQVMEHSRALLARSRHLRRRHNLSQRHRGNYLQHRESRQQQQQRLPLLLTLPALWLPCSRWQQQRVSRPARMACSHRRSTLSMLHC